VGIGAHFLFWILMGVTDSENKIRQIAEAAAASNGVEFVHLEFAGSKKSYTVRIYIDKEGGVSVEDCAEVSRSVEEALDADDLIDSPYVLEVSSPGLERELYSAADFEKFTGRLVKIKFAEPVNERKSIKGYIASVKDGVIEIEEKAKGAEIFRFDHGNVAKANLQVDLNEEFKKRRP
jgi:ribosome maturation factor RimP